MLFCQNRYLYSLYSKATYNNGDWQPYFNVSFDITKNNIECGALCKREAFCNIFLFNDNEKCYIGNILEKQEVILEEFESTSKSIYVDLSK